MAATFLLENRKFRTLGKVRNWKTSWKVGRMQKVGERVRKKSSDMFCRGIFVFSVVSVIIMIIIHIVVAVVLKIFLAKLLNLFCRGSGLCHIKSSIDWFLLAQSLSGRDVGLWATPLQGGLYEWICRVPPSSQWHFPANEDFQRSQWPTPASSCQLTGIRGKPDHLVEKDLQAHTWLIHSDKLR